MFKKSPPQEETTPRVERKERNEQSFLQHGVRIDGDIHADGDLRIDGEVKGTLSVGGTLTAGPKSSITATIKSRSMVIHGSFDGVVRAEERIHLSRGAKVRADLYCQSLVVDEGVFFQGRSHMGETTTAAAEAQPTAARPEAFSAARQDLLSSARRESPATPATPTPPRTEGFGAYRPEPVAGQRTEPSGAGRVEAPAPVRSDAPPIRSSGPSGPSGPLGLGAEQSRVAPDPLRRGPAVPTVTSPRTPNGPVRPPVSPVPGSGSGSGAAPAQRPQTGAEPKPSSAIPSGPTSSDPAK